MRAFQELIDGPLKRFGDLSNDVGGLVAEQVRDLASIVHHSQEHHVEIKVEVQADMEYNVIRTTGQTGRTLLLGTARLRPGSQQVQADPAWRPSVYGSSWTHSASIDEGHKHQRRQQTQQAIQSPF